MQHVVALLSSSSLRGPKIGSQGFNLPPEDVEKAFSWTKKFGQKLNNLASGLRNEAKSIYGMTDAETAKKAWSKFLSSKV